MVHVCVVAACEPSDMQRTVNPGRTQSDASLDAGGSGADARADVSSVATSMPEPMTETGRVQQSTGEVAAAVDAGAIVGSMLWGLQPGSAADDAGVVEQARARLEVVGLGSRILTHVSTGVMDDFDTLRRAPDLSWVVTLPFDVFSEMTDPELDEWVSRVWGLGAQARYLILGQHLENDLPELSDAESARAVERLTSLLQRARRHDAKPPDAAVGLGLVTLAIVPTELLAASDVVALSYSAVKTSGAVLPPDEAFNLLKHLAEEVHGFFRRPVIFQDLAYPSVEGEEAQKAFFSYIHTWVTGGNLPDLRAVVVSSLNPPSAEECAAWAKHWQVQDAEVRCTIGMRDGDHNSKGALNEVVRILAEFAQL